MLLIIPEYCVNTCDKIIKKIPDTKTNILELKKILSLSDLNSRHDAMVETIIM